MPKVIFNPVSEESLQLYPSSTEFFSHWQLNSGILSPNTISNSLNLGATATASATVHLAGTVGENSFINTGNVGIGTTSPSNKLTVNGSFDVTGNLMIGTTGPLGSDGFAENSVLSIVAPTAGGGGRERLLFAKVADSNNYFSVINTTSISSLFIPTFVGYAPDSSAYQGAVYFDGRIASSNDTATGIPAIVFRAQQLDGTTAITNRPIVGFGSGTYGNDMKMVVMSGGNVGIGTTSPAGKLHIKGTADDQQLIVQANATQTTNLTEW